MEELVNNCIYVILAFLILISLIASANKQVASTLLTEHWYLQFEDSVTILPGWGGKFFSDFLTFLILFYNFVPLSVYITMEAVNLFHAFFIDWDAAMYDARSDTAAHARTAALSEDLGQIEYIFSDKTGTLTQNAMVFRACTIAPSRARGGAAAEGAGGDGGPRSERGGEGRTYGKVSTMDAEAKARATAAGASPRSSAMRAVDEEADGAIAANVAALRASRCTAAGSSSSRASCWRHRATGGRGRLCSTSPSRGTRLPHCPQRPIPPVLRQSGDVRRLTYRVRGADFGAFRAPNPRRLLQSPCPSSCRARTVCPSHRTAPHRAGAQAHRAQAVSPRSA